MEPDETPPANVMEAAEPDGEPTEAGPRHRRPARPAMDREEDRARRFAQRGSVGRRALLVVLTGLYAACLALVAAANAAGPERWWWSTVNLYLPQWLWGVPALALAAAYARWWRRGLWAPVALLLVVAGPLMGFRWAFRAGGVLPSGALRLRVMTYNIKWGRNDADAALREVASARPDVLLVQDGTGAAGALARALPGYDVRSFEQYVVASRFPLLSAEVLFLSTAPETRALALRCRVALPGGAGRTTATLYDVHLISPRRGLTAMKAEDPLSGSDVLDDAARARITQARVLAARMAPDGDAGPRIVCGDLNAPVQSLACRALTATGLRDAFDLAGRGYGYTYGHNTRLMHSYMRIDHILVGPEWEALGCWTGGAEGSDHRPVVADLALRR